MHVTKENMTEKKSPLSSRFSHLSNVTVSTLAPEQELPLVIEPTSPATELGEWVTDHWETLEKMLHISGAVLFRGFNLRDDDDFIRFMNSLPQDRLSYFEGSTPRTRVADRVYTSTEYPPTETIALHNEHSSSTKFPRKLWFYCALPPSARGETPMADARKILARIDPGVVKKLRTLGWRLIRNFGTGMGLPWRRAFAIATREELEVYAEAAEIQLEWMGEERLRTHQVRSSTLTHPVTGEEVWFNHVSFWHLANLEEVYREEMLSILGPENLPYRTTYGDGSEIPDEVAHHIRDAYLAEKVKFSWKKGDMMIIDNILAVHGREPFSGARKIRVAMTEPYERPPFPVSVS